MGKKSVVDSSFMESAFEDVNVPTEVRAVGPLYRVEDLQALLIQMLKSAQQTQRKQASDMLVYYYYYYYSYCCCYYINSSSHYFFHPFRGGGDPAWGTVATPL